MGTRRVTEPCSARPASPSLDGSGDTAAMKAVDFDYVRAGSVGWVCRLLAAAREDAKIIAGGQTLVPLLAIRLARPALLIDINSVAELQGIAAGDAHVTVRAVNPALPAVPWPRGRTRARAT